MNNKHLSTLEDIFSDPIRTNLLWSDIESLLIALGAQVSEGRGSRIRVYLKGVHAVFHRPHPQKEVDKGTLKSARRFLIEAGVAKNRE